MYIESHQMPSLANFIDGYIHITWEGPAAKNKHIDKKNKSNKQQESFSFEKCFLLIV